MISTIIKGEALEELSKLEQDSIDLIATDPPYGYSFMNKDWDKAVIGVDTWKQCLRVLKPGAFAFIMSSPRQDVLCKMILNLIDSGFETNFTSLYYSYASGFPKASNTEVVLCKRYAAPTRTQMRELWKTIIEQTIRIESNNDRGTLQTLLACLEQRTQYKIYAYTNGQIEGGEISERQRQSSLEGWNMLQKEKGRLCLCQICKMPLGLYFDGKERRLCYGTQIIDGSVTWQTVDENGMRSSYQSQPIRQSFRKLDVICEQCITQKTRDTNLSGSFLGFQPKPAVEVVLVVMKPLREKSFTDQALANSKGITWLDDCRIPYQSENDKAGWFKHEIVYGDYRQWGINHGYRKQTERQDVKREFNQKGRFPANLIVSDDVLNDGKITKSSGGIRKTAWSNENSNEGWIREAHKHYSNNSASNGGFGDVGSYSRYFDLDKWFSTTFPFIITPKASKSEKNKGLIDSYFDVNDYKFNIETDNKRENVLENKFPCIRDYNIARKTTTIKIKPKSVNDGRITASDTPHQRGKLLKINHHPTVKPIKLMSYLITLGSRKNDIVLDPFCGSGTTCIAAKMLERQYLGIEINQEYVDIANARLKAFELEPLTCLENFL